AKGAGTRAGHARSADARWLEGIFRIKARIRQCCRRPNRLRRSRRLVITSRSAGPLTTTIAAVVHFFLRRLNPLHSFFVDIRRGYVARRGLRNHCSANRGLRGRIVKSPTLFTASTATGRSVPHCWHAAVLRLEDDGSVWSRFA